MGKSSKPYVGMDVHKESIDVATGDESGGEVRHYGRVGGDLESVKRLLRKLESTANELVFVYEAGPSGFWIYRFLRARGQACWVVSPGLTPRSNADRVKTDRRDALKLCRLARAGELSAIGNINFLCQAILANTHWFEKLLQEEFTGGDRFKFSHMSLSSVVIHYFYIFRARIGPAETDTPLIIDTNAVLPLSVTRQRFKAIARRYP